MSPNSHFILPNPIESQQAGHAPCCSERFRGKYEIIFEQVCFGIIGRGNSGRIGIGKREQQLLRLIELRIFGLVYGHERMPDLRCELRLSILGDRQFHQLHRWIGMRSVFRM